MEPSAMRATFEALERAIVKERHAYKALVRATHGTASRRKAEEVHDKAASDLDRALETMRAEVG